MKWKELLQQGLVYLDGGTGTMLQSMGLEPGELPELWNLSHPDRILSLHRAYLQAGCHIISTNTFGANRLKFGDQLPDLITAAVRLARQAVAECADGTPRLVALDLARCCVHWGFWILRMPCAISPKLWSSVPTLVQILF